ncbi:MAG: AAA family ATPase [Chloroflexi bacterium]|nr:AAA family ATPase [Chloroflexota bacterium]
MARLDLHLFGAPRLERDHTPVHFETRKALALLAYLALTRTPHRRDTLATWFWQESDQTHARGALRRTLAALNAVDADWLDTDREVIALNPRASLYVDVCAFRDLLASCAPANDGTRLDSLTRAVEIYRDDFLAGFSLRDSPAFDEWQFFQTEQLRRELANALKQLAQLQRARGEYATALAHAQRWLALDPLHEPAHRELMRVFAKAGERESALRQYNECVRVLDAELGVPPLEETTRLYEAIKSSHAAQIKESAPLLPSPPTPLPIVGRTNELDTLHAIHASIQTAGHLVLIEGEPGIGKTRLVETFLADANAPVVIARCYEGETGLTFAPILSALRAALSNRDAMQRVTRLPAHWVSEAARLLPEIGTPPTTPIESPGAQSRFFEGIARLLDTLLHSTRPGVLLMDDAHWADNASLDLFAFLARRLREHRWLILLTVRELPTQHPLKHLVAELARAGRTTELPLTRLDASAVCELTRAFGLPENVSADLFTESEGLPFFVVEYLHAFAASPDKFDWRLPDSVRRLVRSRLDAASETAQQLLGAAAVIGRSFDFDTLRDASGRSEDETLAALEELLARGLVKEMETPGAQYDFSHDKLRAFAYDQLTHARRRLLHRRVADAQIARHRQDAGAWAAHIANHLQLAGQNESAGAYFRIAGDHARTLFANREALAHYTTALALTGDATLHEPIGDLRTLLGEFSAALASYAAASAAPHARVESKIGNVYARRGEWESAVCHFQNALTALNGNSTPDEHARIYADWSWTAFRAGDKAEAMDLAERALALAQKANDEYALALAHNLLGILAKNAGELDHAREHFETSLALAETLSDPSARIAALNNLARAHAASGNLARAIAFAERALAQCVAQGDRHRQAALRNNLADLLHAAGKSAEAMLQLKQATVLFAEIGAESGETQTEIWKLVEW